MPAVNTQFHSPYRNWANIFFSKGDPGLLKSCGVNPGRIYILYGGCA